MTQQTIAALYVETDGCYFGLDGVEPYDERRDARTYDGPHPVVAHPPCKRWGRYWFGGPSIRVRYERPGMDGGLFADALAKVRRFGGVIEHPEGSHAWPHFGLTKPPKSGGWVRADWPLFDGWTCCVEQGHYGHKARKATWLYAIGCKLPSLIWGAAAGKIRLDEGFATSSDRASARAQGIKPMKRLSSVENLATPEPFRDILIKMARSAEVKI